MAAYNIFKRFDYTRLKAVIIFYTIFSVIITSFAPPVVEAANKAGVNLAPVPNLAEEKKQQVIAKKFITADEEKPKVLGLADMAFTRDSASTRLPVSVEELEKQSFAADETVSVTVNNPDRDTFTTKVTDAKGEDGNVHLEINQKGSESEIKIDGKNQFAPGKYTIEVTDSAGRVSEQDFTWGVLALNTDKSVYRPHEKAEISIGVLDDNGDMVCDAQVELSITNTTTHLTQKLTTMSKEILVNSSCKSKLFTLTPDYQTSYTFDSVGKYTMKLRAITKNGEHEITDSIDVRNSDIPFDVKRTSATRIYPPLDYPMRLEITAQQDFTGTIAETVPESFIITPDDENKVYDTANTVYFDKNDPATKVYSQVLSAQDSKLQMPFDGSYSISQGFGIPLTDQSLREFYAHYGLSGHDGIDFALPMGTPLYAVDDGNVLVAGDGDYGVTVILQHTWGRTYYGHLTKTTIGPNTSVKKGTLIGYSGNTGESTGPHLHFGMKPEKPDMQNGYAGKIDPLPFLPMQSENTAKSLSLSNLHAVLAATDSADQVQPSTEPLQEPLVKPEVTPQTTPTTTPTTPAVQPTQQKVAPVSAQPDAATEEAINNEVEYSVSPVIEKVKVVKWQVSMKKGETIKLSYAFKTPQVSPQFYMVGPLQFFDAKTKDVVFEEERTWQIAADSVGVDWYNKGWTYRKPITVDASKVEGVSAAGSGIAFVQSDLQFTGSGGVETVTLPSVQAGSLLVASMSCFSTSAACAGSKTWTFSDDKGNTWHDLGTRHSTGAGEGQGGAYAYNVAAGTTTITVNTAGQASLVVAEYTGVEKDSDPLETVSSQTYNNPLTVNTLSLSVTTAESNALLALVLENNTSSASCDFTFNNSFNSREEQPSGSGFETVAYADRIVSGAGSYSVTVSNSGCGSGSSAMNAGSLGAFKAEATAGVGAWCNDNTGVTCNSNWAERRKITFDNSASGTNLTNFPVLVKLDSSRIDYGDSSPNDGRDIRFTDATGTTALEHEVESWDESGTSYVWVEVPQIDANSTTDYIWMYYDNDSASAPATELGSTAHATGVWNTDHVGVWHLEQSGAGTMDEYADSSSSDNDGRGGNGTAANVPTRVSGKISFGQDFDGSNDQINVSHATSLQPTNISIGTWVNFDNLAGVDSLISKKDGNGYQLGINDPDCTANTLCFLVRANGAYRTATVAHSTLSAGTWYYIEGTYDGTNVRLYVNGTQVGSSTTTGSITYGSTGDVQLGAEGGTGTGPDPGFYLAGLLDEVRISTTARSADWVEAEYISESDSMNSFGTAQTQADLTGDDLGSSWTDFPVLVSLTSDTDLNGKAQADGGDIVFTTSDGKTKLSHEVESYSAGTLVAWVEVSNLYIDSNTELYMYYGNPSVADQEDVANTWSNSYQATWTMAEGSGTTVADSTSLANNLTLTSSSWSTGKIGNAWNGTGSVWGCRQATCPATGTANDDADLDFAAAGTPTFSMWFKSDSATNPTATQYLLSKSRVDATQFGGYAIYMKTSSAVLCLGIDDDATSWAEQEVCTTGLDYYDATWHYLTATKNGTSSINVYVDGALVVTLDVGTVTGSLDNGATFYLGDRNGTDAVPGDEFAGDLDQVTVSSALRDADWIATEYNNQNDPATFYALGSEETYIYAPLLSEIMRHGKFFDGRAAEQPFAF